LGSTRLSESRPTGMGFYCLFFCCKYEVLSTLLIIILI
jgi:hypothetical protein